MDTISPVENLELRHLTIKKSAIIIISGHRAGPAQHGTVTGRHGTMAIGPRRHAVPHRPAGLAFGPGTGLWAIFRAVLAREARQK